MPAVKTKFRGTREYAVAYGELIRAARYRGTITYQEMAHILGWKPHGSYLAGKVGGLVGEISEDEHLANRPMLSAIVINVKGEASDGFHGLARRLGKLTTQGDHEFWQAEVKAVYQFWQQTFPKT